MSAHVVIVEAISGGAQLARAALDLGLDVTVASADSGDRVLPADLRARISELLVVETNDQDALGRRIRDLHRRRAIDAVFPGCDVYVPAAARLAAELGAVGLPVERVDQVRDKARMRAALAAAGVRSARWCEVDAVEQLVEAGSRIGFPCVLKPADQSGSLHVSKAHDVEELIAAYRAFSEDDLIDLGRPMGSRAVIEEYLDGPELSVEGYVSDGRTTVVAVTEKILGPEPHFAELGHVVPALTGPSSRLAIDRYVAEVTAAVGLTSGPFHCELRLTDRGPVLVEIGARMGGDRIADLVELAVGVSLPRVWLAINLQRDPAELDAFVEPAAPFAAVEFLTAPGERIFVAVDGLDALANCDGVREVRLDVTAGDVIHPLEDFRCRIGHALLLGASREEIESLRVLVRETVHINPRGACHV